MKKYILFFTVAALIVAAAAFTSCKKDEKPKTVTVATQTGTMTAGAAETVTFAVTTENIANGSYDAAMANLPTGVNVQGKVTITGNSGTLTLTGSVATVAGTYNSLTLTIDRTTSNAFLLTIAPAQTYTISALPVTLLFGSLQTPYTQPSAQTVVVTNTGTGTVTLNALPTVPNYTLGALSATTLAAGAQATFTVQPNAGLAAGTYNPTITVTGSGGVNATVSVSFEVTTAGSNTYAISASPTTLPFGSLQSPYTQPAAQTVTITNTGTETVTLNTLPTVANYTLGALSTNSIAAGATATFTVQPNAGLAEGTYNRDIIITGTNGTSATVAANFTVTASNSGNGTPGNPFKVANYDDLQKVGTETDGWTNSAHYQQTANIIVPAGTNWTKVGGGKYYFTGSYDGGGFSISNLAIDRPTENSALFSLIGEGGVVKNVALLNVNIKGDSNVGGVAVFNSGRIQNCSVSGSIISSTSSGYGTGVGSVVASNDGTVENCYTTCNLSGYRNVGGVAGSNNGMIQNCYATGNVSGDEYIGGVVGTNHGTMAMFNNGTVQNCFATGNVSGKNYVGGIAGSNTMEDFFGPGGIIKNCVALNKEVKATNTTLNIGRVVGGWGTVTGLTNNYARSAGMIITGSSGAVSVSPSATGFHGANVTQANYDGSTSGTWWSSTAGFSSANWEFANNRLPHLKPTGGGSFSQAQNPTVTP